MRLTSRVFAGLPEGSKVFWTLSESSKNIREGTGLSGVIGVVSELGDSIGLGTVHHGVFGMVIVLSETFGKVNALTEVVE